MARSLAFLLYLCSVAVCAAILDVPQHILNGTFPPGFKFGVSTSSYQVEGGWLEGGKGLSIWDAMSHIPGKIAHGDTGDVANDMYHLYPQDIKLMAHYGLKNYRFSIAWNRIMPTGLAPVNPEGIAYYNDLINQLLANGIEPHVTMYHSETPLGLTMYPYLTNPFLDDRFAGWFTDYAKVLLDNFGDRVKTWFTFNEPFCTAVYGPVGNKDPYIVAHNAILAHASVVNLYRANYKASQAGTVGIVLNTAHFYPNDPNNAADVETAARGYDFWYGWFMDPLTKGEYPQRMRDTVGDRLPKFTEEQKKQITGALDFVAINYYFPYVITPGTYKASDDDCFYKDMNITTGFADWPLSQTGWGIYAPGLRDLLIYSQNTYTGVPLYVTENGLAWKADNVTDAVNDVQRQSYLYNHINAVGEAIAAGVDMRGYFVWSFQDNLEWNSGYEMTFGVIYIERPSLKRIVKDSLRWYSKAINTHAAQAQSKK